MAPNTEIHPGKKPAGPGAPPRIFSRALCRIRQARAAAFPAEERFLHKLIAEDIEERLTTVTRQFPASLFYGLDPALICSTSECGLDQVISAGLVAPLGRAAKCKPDTLVFDEDFQPLGERRFDLIVSVLSLHHTNDLIGALTQYRLALKPDGLLIAVMFGEGTLGQFRRILAEAELSATGKVHQRTTPLASVRDMGGALQRAGFAMPVTDVDTINVSYRSTGRLVTDIRAMGQGECLAARPPRLPRACGIAELDKVLVPPFDETYALITATGWAPAPSQPKPLAPGSAKASLADAVLSKKKRD